MTDMEKREAARNFFKKWNGKGQEDEDDRSFWIDILQRILGIDDATDRIEFQKKVIVDENTKKIDVYIPETKTIIEQKSLGVALDKKAHQSGGVDLTPYEQAKRYNDNLPSSEKARWIITSNFAEIWIYDMDTREPEKNVTILNIRDLQTQYQLLEFLLNKKIKVITQETELSLKAGELVGKIYDRFLEQYRNPSSIATQNSLNILCVRIVFCLYAEDAGLFGDKDAFTSYLSQYEPKDLRSVLIELFKVLDTPIQNREELYLSDELAAFPYVNGGLFAKEDIEIPKITQEIKDVLLEASHFDWSRISPTIFGAVFESTLNPETRRSGGMHYTSIENIHKVIDPLFLDDLKEELQDIMKIAVQKTRTKRLHDYQEKLSHLKFFDPACGSGNFLTETYVSIRRLENEVLKELQHGLISLADETISPIMVSIHQFFGIEINDFAVTVAKTALWIAESQMMKETEDVVQMHLDFLPLKTNAEIIEGNALTIDWNTIVDKNELSYIMGNPPFVGARYMSKEQKDDLLYIFGSKWENTGNLDYVSCWYKKCADFIFETEIKVALVSTNSITQGEQVSILWKPLFSEKKIHFDFAYKTFIWDSEANMKAHVHCVIIGFSATPNNDVRILFDGNNKFQVKNINAYLLSGDDIFIESRKKAICDSKTMVFGSTPIDDGNLIIEASELDEFIKKEPLSKKYIRPLLGSREFINGLERYCLWLVDCSPAELRKMPFVMERVQAIQMMRENSKRAATNKLKDKPALFGEIRQPQNGSMLIVPLTSSERRRYVPIGFVEHTTIATNLVQMIPGAEIYDFGILNSNVFMSWMRAVGGKLKSDYRITVTNVYNNFPWPTPTEEQRSTIEKTAQLILDARALYPDCSLADLYDPLTMPPELRKAHQQNDKAVMQAYGLSVKDTSEADCVAFLMKRYQELTKQ